MKAANSYNKLRGGYYTPADIAEFIIRWAIRSPADSVLEPSCGDGSFLSVMSNIWPLHTGEICGVEIDPTEAAKARTHGYPIINDDFFSYYNQYIEGKRAFDVIVGNPPFIRYQNFDEAYRSVAFQLMQAHGFHPNRLTNIWLPFLLLCAEALSPEGRIGMVIPAELFQVDYAAEARKYLSSHFDKLILVTFKQLVFDGIQQEVVLLLGEKNAVDKGIKVVELNGLEDLMSESLTCLDRAETKRLDHSTEKWVKYYLTNDELAILSQLKADERISSAAELYEINVGLVSGENDFFIRKWEDIVEHGITAEVEPIISRSEQVKGIILTPAEHDALKADAKRVSIFLPGDLPLEELSDAARKYIQWGEQQGYNTNYKCRIRKRWYVVPTSWKADAFLIRQANLYPKLILNDAGAYVTDTLHKVRFLNGVDGRAVTAAFLNTYTFALSETLGRSYGGGVLTFEPGEMRRMRIPMIGAEKLDVNKIDTWQREKRYEDILSYTDQILLREGLQLSDHEVALLHSIWNKMRNRRLSRKQSVAQD